MPGNINTKQILNNDDVLNITNLDRFRPTLMCDLFIPSYIHSLSVATEYIYNYVFSRFPKDYFSSIHIVGKNPLEDFRRMEVGDYVKREPPAANLSYSIQYDFNDNNIDFNWLSTNKYLRQSMWQRSFFKCPQKGLYIGMDFETMLINYNFKFKVASRAIQLDLYNRIRKVFRLGCTETNDIDMDFHLDYSMMTKIASEVGFQVDSNNGQILDPWNFTRFMNKFSQMPILYKLRLINQKYEFFMRMSNMPVHLDFQNSLDVDDGNPSGMLGGDYNIEFQIAVRFPAPRTFALYNEGHWEHQIHTEDISGINVFSMKVYDIPEANYKGWPMYGHSNYLPDEDEKIVKEIDIRELFKAPIDVKIGTSLHNFIQDSIAQFRDPSSFIEVAVYTNDLLVNGSGRVPVRMDWENRKIILPENTVSNYFYLAIYVEWPSCRETRCNS